MSPTLRLLLVGLAVMTRPSLAAPAAAANKTSIQIETGVELGEALLARSDKGKRPDVVLAPSDVTGSARSLELSEIPAS